MLFVCYNLLNVTFDGRWSQCAILFNDCTCVYAFVLTNYGVLGTMSGAGYSDDSYEDLSGPSNARYSRKKNRRTVVLADVNVSGDDARAYNRSLASAKRPRVTYNRSIVAAACRSTPPDDYDLENQCRLDAELGFVDPDDELPADAFEPEDTEPDPEVANGFGNPCIILNFGVVIAFTMFDNMF